MWGGGVDCGQWTLWTQWTQWTQWTGVDYDASEKLEGGW